MNRHVSKILLTVGMGVLFLHVRAASAQTPLPVIGRDIFVTFNSDTVFGWTSELVSFNVRNVDTSTGFVSFGLMGISCGFACNFNTVPILGAYGPILTDGVYEAEAFLFEQGSGNLGGFYSFLNILPSTIPHAVISAPFSGTRMGVRISRVDRRMIELTSVEHATVDSNFEIGTNVTNYADFADFQSIAPPVLGSPALQFLNLPNVPIVRRLQTAPGAFLVNAANGTFSMTTTIRKAVLDSGAEISSSTSDPLIGGTLTIGGSITGSDLSGFSDVTMTATTFTLTAAGGVDQIQFQKSLAAGSDHRALAGLFETMPAAIRLLEGGTSSAPQRAGSGSALLNALVSQFTSSLVLRVSIWPYGPILESIEFDFQAPLQNTTEHRWATDGSGGVSFGIVRAPMGTVFRNFASFSPTIPVGQGPFFGIEFGPDQIPQILVPFGTNPLYSGPDATGSYFWGTPPGAIPVGLVIDLSYVEIDPLGGFLASQITRLNF